MKDTQNSPLSDEDGASASQNLTEPSPEPKNAVERLYDRIPVSVKQVDRFIRFMIVVLLVVLIFAIAKAAGG